MKTNDHPYENDKEPHNACQAFPFAILVEFLDDQPEKKGSRNYQQPGEPMPFEIYQEFGHNNCPGEDITKVGDQLAQNGKLFVERSLDFSRYLVFFLQANSPFLHVVQSFESGFLFFFVDVHSQKRLHDSAVLCLVTYCQHFSIAMAFQDLSATVNVVAGIGAFLLLLGFC